MRKGKRLPLEVLTPYLLEPQDSPALLSWPAVFANEHPVEIEVGFGKGPFLVVAAPLHPETNYLGLEIDRGLQLYVANRVAKRELRNVRLAKADARLFLRDYVAANSVQAIHVDFPDPWWKKRHKKRRVFTGDFAAHCERVLEPGGRLHLATDVEEYFGVMTALVSEHTKLQPVEPTQDVAVVTNFERKAKERGQNVWRASFAKRKP